MKSAVLKLSGAVAVVLCAATALFGQGTPAPGPTNPNPKPPADAKPGKDLVANPTTEECNRGWNANLKWTKEQFEQFCATMRAAK
jgi:hypothetical protein